MIEYIIYEHNNNLTSESEKSSIIVKNNDVVTAFKRFYFNFCQNRDVYLDIVNAQSQIPHSDIGRLGDKYTYAEMNSIIYRYKDHYNNVNMQNEEAGLDYCLSLIKSVQQLVTNSL